MPIVDKNNVEEMKKYEEFVLNSPFGRYSQSIHWAKVKNNWENDYVYLQENDEIIAAISILSIKNDSEHSFMYATRGPVCDIRDVELFKRLMEEVKPIAQKNNAFLLRMDPEVKYSDELIKIYKDNGINIRTSEDPASHTSNPAYNMIFKFEENGEKITQDNLINYFPSKTRNLVRKTYREGLKTRIIDKDSENYENSLDKLYELILTVSDRNDIGHRPKSYFDNLMKNYEDAKILETYTENGEVLSSCLLITYNPKTYYLYSGSSNEMRKLNASYQMNYEAMLYAISKGALFYDFGGVFGLDKNDNLYFFKNKFTKKDGYTRYIGEIDIVYNQKLYEDFIK